jgi:hypothetical protein
MVVRARARALIRVGLAVMSRRVAPLLLLFAACSPGGDGTLTGAIDGVNVRLDRVAGMHIEQTVPTGGHHLQLDGCRAEAGVAVVAITVTEPADGSASTPATAPLALDVPWATANPQHLGKLRLERRRLRDGAHYFVAPKYETLLELQVPQ